MQLEVLIASLWGQKVLKIDTPFRESAGPVYLTGYQNTPYDTRKYSPVGLSVVAFVSPIAS